MIVYKILGFFLLFLATNMFASELLQSVQIPKDTKSDWLELKSGEWVRGTFKGIYSGEVEFDSEEFNLVTFDIDDVKQIVTLGESTLSLNREPLNLRKYVNLEELKNLRPANMLNDSGNDVTGNLSYKNGSFFMLFSDGKTKQINPANVASVYGGELSERSYWSASVFFGIDIMSGNTEQVSVTSKASMERKTVISRFRVDYIGKYTQHDGNKTTADNDNVKSSLDYYLTQHLYWRFVGFQYLSDRFKNITAKYTYSTGIGYDIIYTKETDWSLTIGPGYQRTEYTNVQVNEEARVETALLFLDTRFKEELTDSIDLLLNYTMYLVNHESGDYVHHAEISLETEIVHDFKFDISLFWDRTSAPIAFDSGEIPGKDDFKTMVSLGYSY